VTKWQRSPRQLGHVVDQLRDQLAPDTVLAEVQRVWPAVVGPAIAAEAQPTAERGGVVVVSCSASVWAQELDLMAPAILERLNEALGAQRVSRLRCVATAPIERKSR
jgi:predicted nucleic acid-binding Zn ribbon protein